MSFYKIFYTKYLNILDTLEFTYCKRCSELLPRFSFENCEYCMDM